jgi:hypothetical protein
MYIDTAIINRIDPVKKAMSENRLRFNRNGSYSYTPSKEYELKYGKIAKEKHLEKITLRDATIVCARRLGKIANALDRGKKVARIQGGIMMGS